MRRVPVRKPCTFSARGFEPSFSKSRSSFSKTTRLRLASIAIKGIKLGDENTRLPGKRQPQKPGHFNTMLTGVCYGDWGWPILHCHDPICLGRNLLKPRSLVVLHRRRGSLLPPCAQEAEKPAIASSRGPCFFVA